MVWHVLLGMMLRGAYPATEGGGGAGGLGCVASRGRRLGCVVSQGRGCVVLGVVSCRVVSCRVVSCRVVSCRVVSCCVVLCCVVLSFLLQYQAMGGNTKSWRRACACAPVLCNLCALCHHDMEGGGVAQCAMVSVLG